MNDLIFDMNNGQRIVVKGCDMTEDEILDELRCTWFDVTTENAEYRIQIDKIKKLRLVAETSLKGRE